MTEAQPNLSDEKGKSDKAAKRLKICRRATYKLYPNKTQLAEIERICELHRHLYNAALEERIGAYKKAGKSIGLFDQCKSLTVIRAENPEYKALNVASCVITLRRLELAYKSFFRRAKNGEDPGFPRFKSRDRFPGFGYGQSGYRLSGFKFDPGPNWLHGRLTIKGLGSIAARGSARTPGKVLSCDLMRKVDGWHLSLVLECEPHRETITNFPVGLDWGVENFATMAYGGHLEGVYVTCENDRFLNQEADKLKTHQREFSKVSRGKRSKRIIRAKLAVARKSRKVSNRRKNFLHKITSELVAHHNIIITERLDIASMTESAAGTVEKPGKGVKNKSRLNKAILDTAPGSFYSMLKVKAEEAGRELIILDTFVHKPSQTCPNCGHIRKKSLAERLHWCGCGFISTRDQAAALYMLRAGLGMRRQPSQGATP